MRPKKRNAIAALGALLTLALCSPCLAASADWTGLDWLVGRWTGEGGGAATGSGDFTFEREAGGQALVRRNVAFYPPTDGKPAQRHDDLMVIWPDGAAVRATYWDSEGHVIHYAVTVSAAGDAVFVSDDAAGPRFRLSYHRTDRGLAGLFEIAPPNARERFAPYLQWTARRAS